MKKVLIWIGIIFVGLIIVGTITGKEGGKDTNGSKDKLVTEAKYKIGDVVTVGNLEYKAEEVSQAKELENENISEEQEHLKNQLLTARPGEHFEPNSRFLIVKITVTNIGIEHKENIYPSMFKLVEDNGTEFDVDVSAGVYIEGNDDFFLTNINPKSSKIGYVVFDIPTLESCYALKVSGGLFSEREELIYFTNEKIIKYRN